MASDLKTRAVLAPTMLGIVALIYWLDYGEVLGIKQGALSAGLLLLLGVLGAQEYVHLLRGQNFAVAGKTLVFFTTMLLVSAFPLGWHEIDHEFYPLVIGTMLLLFPLAVRSLGKHDMKVGLEKQGATLLGFLLVAWPMYLAIGTCFRHLPSVLFVVLVCKGGDIGGYCVGRLIGRHKLIPHISPGKTVEGALGSLATSVALTVALRGPLLEPEVHLPLWAALLTGVVLNFTTQTGDLIESLLKRRCGAKDSSHLLPAHGGVLDLVDSLLFSFCAWFQVLILIT
ncbi:MAG: phosphatidate cytidylyltransferase [Planctomycetes bacterium]|nr:phosphatidate cytidylyltransferase [Planctomycetota bacterium]MCB9887613.1 phosphatidate cytidylyltransferase [Planctomycetota bacterium]